MHIEHIALWTEKLEELKDFYTNHFQAIPGPKYVNPESGFESHFLTFHSGARLELMRKPGLKKFRGNPDRGSIGMAHFAFAAGSEAGVDGLTARLERSGYTVVGKPRRTGDGYYESCVLDPDGNRVEITA